MKVVQLRGTNGVGKTETVRQFINKGGFRVENIQFKSLDVGCHYDAERKILVLGRYDTKKSGGIDGTITNRDKLIDFIMFLGRTLRPNTIVFEGIVYGVTYQFCKDVVKACASIGYEYTGICLMPPLEVAIERVGQRNGGKDVDIMSIQNKWFTASRAYTRLKRDGINVKAVDTSRIPRDKMGSILESEI